jgi:hypothetical protein
MGTLVLSCITQVLRELTPEPSELGNRGSHEGLSDWEVRGRSSVKLQGCPAVR